MNQFELLDRGGQQFGRVLVGVTPDQWALATPCAGWSVRDLVAHVVGGSQMAVLLLEGGSRDAAIELRRTDHLGDDPMAAFIVAQADVVVAFQEPGALGRTCTHPMGDIPGATLLGFRIGDLTLHAWDLARAIGADETLDPELVEAVWTALAPMGGGAVAASGVFGAGPSGTVPADAPLQVRLLDFTGRRP